MTNHSRSPRQKFKVGQVVCLPRGSVQPRDRYARLVEFEPLGTTPAWLTTDGYWHEASLRPLTKKEAGSRISGKAVKPKK